MRGVKRKPYTEDEYLVRQERKYGDFEMRFKIPQEYERKWHYFGVENGVLKIEYLKDEDDVPIKYNWINFESI